MYFYHPDHLGSTSYITDASGEVTQHIEYMAFGELFVEEGEDDDIFGDDEGVRYLFNAKELDEETGYYYGARYYDARASVWLSVDPLSDKYPNLSPYAYVANNPVNLIDPNGMEIIGDTKAVDNLKDKAQSIIASENKRQARFERRIESRSSKGKSTSRLEGKLSTSQAREGELNTMLSEIKDLEDSETVYNINTNYADQADGTSGNTSYGNNQINIDVSESYGMAGLAHELKHAAQFEAGEIDFFKATGSPGLLYDITDEIAAFKRQFAISPNSANVDDSFVRNLNPVYKSLPGYGLNKNSTLMRLEVNWRIKGYNVNLTNGKSQFFNVRYREANYSNLISK